MTEEQKLLRKEKQKKRLREVWNKKCQSGRACAGTARENLPENRHFVPDDEDECDYCLLAKYDLESMPVEGDIYGMCTAYSEESVVEALRKAEKSR